MIKFMSIQGFVALLLLLPNSGFGADRDVSNYVKGLLCKKAIVSHADLFDSNNSQIVACRTKGTFSNASGNEYQMTIPTKKGFLRCNASLSDSDSGSKSGVVTLSECTELFPKSKAAKSSKSDPSNDTVVNCRPASGNDEYKSFSIRVRETTNGPRMVKNSASAAPLGVKPLFKSFEIQPHIVTFEKDIIETYSGNDNVEVSLSIEKDQDSKLWFGRLRIWRADQSSTLKSKVQCFVNLDYSNGEDVIEESND